MTVIPGEGLYRIRLLLRDIDGLACRSLLNNTLENAISAKVMPRIFINWGGILNSLSSPWPSAQ